jgi:hypothetical protein
MIDWQEAWQIAAIALGFTFGILYFLCLLTLLASKIISFFPGNSENGEERPANNNLAAGE